MKLNYCYFIMVFSGILMLASNVKAMRIRGAEIYEEIEDQRKFFDEEQEKLFNNIVNKIKVRSKKHRYWKVLISWNLIHKDIKKRLEGIIRESSGYKQKKYLKNEHNEFTEFCFRSERKADNLVRSLQYYFNNNKLLLYYQLINRS